jgi:aminoglycoside 2''-phosphotransferase
MSFDAPLENKLKHYRHRIRAVYPEIEASTIRLIENDGQNNDVVVVDEGVVCRFPRSAEAIERLAAVARILGTVGPRITLAVPDPIYLSLEPPTVGQAFLGYPLIPGQPLWRETLEAITDFSVLQRLATQLAGFLQELHRVPIEQAVPDHLIHLDPLARWQDLYARIRDRLFPHMWLQAQQSVAHRFEAFLSDPGNLTIVPALVHGDFGTGNFLYGPEDMEITGVIDFDAAGVGDPAMDLEAALTGPTSFTRCFTRVYPVTEEIMERVRFYQGTFALQEALFGIETGTMTPSGAASARTCRR